jgi:hypothetical protein
MHGGVCDKDHRLDVRVVGTPRCTSVIRRRTMDMMIVSTIFLLSEAYSSAVQCAFAFRLSRNPSQL